MKRVLLLCPEPVRPTMAGVGIRFRELARTLARRFSVSLGIPNDPVDAPALDGVTVSRYDGETIAHLCRQADSVVLQGHVFNLYFAAGVRWPLVVDLYDPFPIQNLNYFPVLADSLRRLLASAELRSTLAERGRRWAADHTWAKVLGPLEEFLLDPRPDPHKNRYPALAPPFREPGAGRGWLRRVVGRG